MSEGLTQREVVSAKNRPDLRKRKEGILFHDEGATGWGRIRELGDYKHGIKEGNFDHLNHLWSTEGEAE